MGIREVAAAAKTNVASIAFHFGGKEGLYAAVIERVAEEIAGSQRAVVTEAQAASDAAGEDATARVQRLMAGFITRYLTSNRSRWIRITSYNVCYTKLLRPAPLTG